MADTEATSVESRVRDLIGRTFSLTPEETGGDLRMGNPVLWDSVGHMDLIFALEKEFGISIPTYKVAELQSVPSIVKALEVHSTSA